MPQPAYSTRIYGPATPPTSAGTLWTVPAGRVYVVRTLCIVLVGITATPTVAFWINGSGASDRWFRRLLAGDQTYNEIGRWVFGPGDSCLGIGTGLGGGQTLAVSMHGYDLSA